MQKGREPHWAFEKKTLGARTSTHTPTHVPTDEGLQNLDRGSERAVGQHEVIQKVGIWEVGKEQKRRGESGSHKSALKEGGVGR